MTDPLKALLFILCGVCFHAGFASLVVGLRLRRDPVFTLFGLMGIAMALYAAVVTLTYLTDDAVFFRPLLRLSVVFGCFAYLALTWFIASITGYTPKGLLPTVTIGSLVIAMAALVHPTGLTLADLGGVTQRTATWGEQFRYANGPASIWHSVLFAACLFCIAYTARAAWITWHRGDRAIGLSIGIGAALLLVTILLDILVVAADMPSLIVWQTLGMLVLVMLMSYHVAERLFLRGQQLETVNAAMRRESEARSAALGRQERLTEELNHRVRNNLASVLSLINVTRHNAESVPGFADTLRSRVRAMSEAHELLAQGNWESVSLREMLETILKQFVHFDTNRVRLSGTEVTIRPGQTVPLAMALHELAVNALAHGSLGKPGGILEVRWEQHVELDEVELVWREIGLADSPAEKRDGGRGLSLVRGFIEHELGGRMDWAMEPTGARCELTWPLTMQRVSLVDHEGKSLDESASFSFKLLKKP